MQGPAMDAPIATANRSGNRLKQAWRWVYALALYAFLKMSVWMLSLVVLASGREGSKHRQPREHRD